MEVTAKDLITFGRTRLDRDGDWLYLRCSKTNQFVVKMHKDDCPKGMRSKQAIRGYLYANAQWYKSEYA